MGSLVMMGIVGFFTWLWAKNKEGLFQKWSVLIGIIGGLLWPLTIILALIGFVLSIIKNMFSSTIADLKAPVDFNNPPDMSALKFENMFSDSIKSTKDTFRPRDTDLNKDRPEWIEASKFICMHCGERFIDPKSANYQGCHRSPTNQHVLTAK